MASGRHHVVDRRRQDIDGPGVEGRVQVVDLHHHRHGTQRFNDRRGRWRERHKLAPLRPSSVEISRLPTQLPATLPTARTFTSDHHRPCTRRTRARYAQPTHGGVRLAGQDAEHGLREQGRCVSRNTQGDVTHTFDGTLVLLARACAQLTGRVQLHGQIRPTAFQALHQTT